jgi:hypothetical protein
MVAFALGCLRLIGCVLVAIRDHLSIFWSRAAGKFLAAPRSMVLAHLVAALALRPTAVPVRRSGVSMTADASTLDLKAQILQVAALTDRGQRLNTLSEWHASNNTKPTYLPS